MKKEEAGAMGKAVKRREREAKIFIGSWGGGGEQQERKLESRRAPTTVRNGYKAKRADR